MENFETVYVSRCAIRLQLLIVHKFSIQSLPSLFTLKNFLNGSETTKSKGQITPSYSTSKALDTATFTLKHSGRVVRSIRNSPANLETRDWKIPTRAEDSSRKDHVNDTVEIVGDTSEIHFDVTQDKQRYLAEILHIIRPISHLTSLLIFDSKSWKQFMVPFSIDILSLSLLSGTRGLSKSQQNEMRRRAVLIMHYFIRSPFYDCYSRSVITVILSQIEQRVAGSKHLIGPVKSYIEQWRAIYNYCWSS